MTRRRVGLATHKEFHRTSTRKVSRSVRFDLYLDGVVASRAGRGIDVDVGSSVLDIAHRGKCTVVIRAIEATNTHIQAAPRVAVTAL